MKYFLFFAVSACALLVFKSPTFAQSTITGGGTGSVLASSGNAFNDGTDDITVVGTGGVITLDPGITVTNDGTQANAALNGGANQSLINLNNNTLNINRFIITDNSTISSTGGNGSAVIVARDAGDNTDYGIVVSTSNGIIEKTGGSAGNAIRSNNRNFTVNNTGIIRASAGEGTILSRAGNLAILNSGSILNTDSASNDDAVRSEGDFTVDIDLQNGSLVSSTNGGQAIDLSLGTGNQTIQLQGNANVVGDILLGGDDGGDLINISYVGSGNSTYNDDITGLNNASVTNLTVNRINAGGDTVFLGGVLSNFDDINVTDGTLNINGSVINNTAFNIDSNGVLKGTGTIASSTLTNNGLYAVGNSIGTQILTGNYVQGGNGTLQVEFDNTGIDLVDISGVANLNGTASFVELATGITQDTPHTFLEADGGVNGTFSNVTETFFSGSSIDQATVGYNATSAFVTFSEFEGVDTSPEMVSQGGGQKVAAAINQAAMSSPSVEVVDVVNALQSSDNLGNSLESQSNIVGNAAMMQANGAIGRITNVVRTRMELNNSGQTGLSSGDNYFHRSFDPDAYWFQALGGVSDVDGDSNGLGSDSVSYGAAVGTEYKLNDSESIIGAFVGYTKNKTDVDTLKDESEVDNYQLGIYGSHIFGTTAWRVNGALSASYFDFDTARDTALGIASANFEGYGAYATTEVAYDISIDEKFSISPYVGIESSIIKRKNYTEFGAGALNNAVDQQRLEFLKSVVGTKIKARFVADQFEIISSLKLGWVHEYLDDSAETNARFSQAPSVVFQTQGPERNRDSARISANLEIGSDYDEYWKGYLDYDGNVASDAQAHAVRIGVKYSF